jgi:hypothetical protein
MVPGIAADPAGAGAKWLASPDLFRMSYGVATTFLNPPSAGASVLLRLLSAQPADLLQSRNVVPHFENPRYLSSANQGQAIAANGTSRVTSQAIQLAQLPDYFLICVRRPMSTQTVADTSSFLTIRNISINLNNQSGLLSSSSAQDLWRLSQKNHSQQSWTSFSGHATVATGTGTPSLVPTTGSLLVLSPTDLSLPQNLAPGSLGAFSFQFTAEVYNQFGVGIVAEICVIACNSGIMTINQGTTSIYTGLLTRDAVDMALQTKPVQMQDRLVGGQLNRGLAMNPKRFGMLGSALSAGAQSAGKMMTASKLRGMY